MSANQIRSSMFRAVSIGEPLIPVSPGQEEGLRVFREKCRSGAYTFEVAKCLCGSECGELLARRDRYGLSVSTYLCQHCGMMWTNPRMTAASLAKFYKEDYRQIYVGAVVPPETFFLEQVQHGRFIKNYIGGASESDSERIVFDVGCGAGGVLVPFREAKCSVYGCDFGPQYLERGQKDKLVLQQGDIRALSQYGEADIVILSHVLEHMSDPREDLRRIYRQMRSGGLLYVELPGILNIHAAYGDFMLFLQNAHLYHYTLATLTNIMASVNFSLVKGDECIHALYRKDTHCSQSKPIGESRRIRTYLVRLQLYRLLRRVHLYTISRSIARRLGKIFGKTVMNAVQNVVGIR